MSHPGQHGYTTTINENSIKTTFHILTDQVNRMGKIVLFDINIDVNGNQSI